MINCRAVRRPSAFVLAILGLALALGAPRTAAAQSEKVVVLDFEGPRGSQTRAAVVGALRREIELVPLTEFEQAAQDAGVSSYTGQDLVAACRPVGAVAAVSGEVLREGGFVLRMTLRNCADGEVLDLYTVGFRGRRINTRDLSDQVAAMIERIRSGAQAAAQEPEPEPEPQPEPGEGEGEEGEGEEGEGEEGPPATDSFLDASLTLGLANRSLEVTSLRDDISAVVYKGGAYSEIGVLANFYPVRLTKTQGVLRGLGLRLSFARHLIASSQPRDDPAGPEVSTSLLELGADLMLGIKIGDAPKPPVLGLAVGYGLKDFVLGENQYVASFQYRFLRFGVFAEYPVADLFVPFVSLGYRLVMSVGDAEAFYGPEASASAFDLSIGTHGTIVPHVIYEAAFEYLSYSLTFTQPAGATPPGLPGGDGSDTYLRGRLAVGYAF